ncbi:MAG: hypothetical protein ACRDLB_06570 [Actinomycetota bacterium]
MTFFGPKPARYTGPSRKRKRVRGTAGVAPLLAVVLAALIVPSVAQGAPSVAAKKGTVHEPPYKPGPTGGDEFNHIEADPSSGNMAVLRVFPGIPPVVGCTPEPSAGWAMFHVKHTVKQPVSKVSVAYTAALDAYSWITVGARDAKGEWLGVKKRQGPLAEEAEVTASLFDRPKRGEKITIEFGLQLGDACPQVGQASAMFPSVTVK